MDAVVFILAALGAMLAWGVGDFLIQRSVRAVGSIQALAFIGIVGSFGLLPFVIGDISALTWGAGLLILVVLGIVTYAVAILSFDALRDGKLSIIDVLLELELPIVILLGFLFFRETLTTAQSIVVLFIFLGMVLIAVERFSWKGNTLEKGVLLGVAAAIGMGVLDFLTAAGARLVSPIMAIWIPWVVFTVICFIMITKRREWHSFTYNARSHSRLVFGVGIVDTLAWVFYAIALTGEGVGVTTAITEAYPALAVLLGVLVNKEKVFAHQWAGVALALGGCIALSLLLA
jgi:drug/metabolite transporter (DMT)-like permease